MSNLNRKMAEVMGWRYEEDLEFTDGNAPGYYMPKEKTIRHLWSWHPTTDIAQAMDVLMKIKEQNSVYSIELEWLDYGPDTWTCIVIAEGNLYLGEAPTSALAICKAVEKVRKETKSTYQVKSTC